MSKHVKYKIMILSLLSVAITAAVLVIIVLISRGPMIRSVDQNFKELGRGESGKIAKMVYDRCACAQVQREELIEISLLIAHDKLAAAGQVRQDPAQLVAWSAVDQFSQASAKASLPAFEIGEVWLGQNSTAGSPTPVVDDIVKAVGGAATIFQRMNEQGDMLRVATTVLQEDGARAIGTYIPAIEPDGAANPIVAAVLKGETYHGTANVVGTPYVAAYEPITDPAGAVIGMLFVGVEQIDPALRDWIKGLIVGKAGYVFALQGQGEAQGTYIISKGGERDGENIWEAKDDKGKLFIQEMINMSLAAAPGEIGYVEYDWKNKDETAARKKVSAVTYFPGTDWVIGAGTYYSDFSDTVEDVRHHLDLLVFCTLGIALVLVGVGIWVSSRIANKISGPLVMLVEAARLAADGDLTPKIARIEQTDEVGQLADAFRHMLENTHQAVKAVAKAAVELAHTSEELSSGADETGRAVDEVAHATGQMAIGAQSVTENISHAEESLRQNAKAVEGIAKDIEAVAVYATEASRRGGEGRKAADEGSAVIQRAAASVRETTGVVQHLGEKTKQIAQFIGIITGIADQTNLLALNAAIEAARAGDAGRGFAVVAEEVRKLAEESNQAAGSITSLVMGIESEMQAALAAMDKSDREVSEGAVIVQQAGSVLGQIIAGVDALSGKVQAISSAAEEISANTGDIVATMETVMSLAEGNAASSQQVSSATEEQNASMQEISSSANNLANLAQELSQLVRRFKV